ncbi:hypothetical protein PN797_004801 [Enterobacter hormaechei]|nr:hypothetical protein [Enterobacter hormaechei]
MAFKSQLKASKASSRRGSSASIVISQTHKPSTGTQEFSIRISSEVLSRMGLEVGTQRKVDVLFDSENDLWMIQVCGDDGFTITGKEGAATGLIRYTLKKGHARFTEDQTELPIKRESNEDSIEYKDGAVIFKLHEDE